jgi:outer membrane protein assembly factor BamB
MHPTRPCARRLAVRLLAAASCALCVGGAALAQAKQPSVLWKYAPKGSNFDDVLARDGTVFALDRAGAIHAIDAATGEKRWTSEGKLVLDFGFGIAFSGVPAFDAVLVGSDTGLFAFDRATGKKRWFTAIAAGVAGPACTNTMVVAGSADGNVYGCELATGRIRWQSEYLEDRPDDPPGFVGAQARFQGKPARPCNATTDGTIVALSVFDQCRTLAFDAATGKRLWDFRTQGWMYGRPAFGALHVFVGSQDKNFYAVDKETGKLAWQVETGDRVEAGAFAAERFVYFGSCDGNLYAVDQGVGRVPWKFPTEPREDVGAPIYSRPLVRGDTVYLAAMMGTVYAVDRTTGKLRWRIEPLAKSELVGDLAADGDTLFVTTRASGDAGESAVVAIKLP